MNKSLSQKNTLATLAFALVLAAAAQKTPAAFEWPAKNLDASEPFFTFAQNRKGRFNQSIIFKNAREAAATDKGKILAVITEKQGDGDWFESPLGNALVVSHDDALISVYGNLSQESAAALSQKSFVQEGETLGTTAASSWSESDQEGSLEFQIADSNSKTFINPIILMPRSVKPPKISLEGISIENQFGRTYNMAALRSVPAGVYKVYKKRQADIVAYKSEIYVNGAEVEKIAKETIKGMDGRLAISGSDGSYESSEFYPSDELEFLGHVLLPHGSNTVTIKAADIYDSAVTANYSVSGY